MKIKWNDISKYRDELFGIAIISIMVFHYFEGVLTSEYMEGVSRVFAKLYIGAVGSIGVDIFLYLSGIGIYYSLDKNPKLLDFYFRRVKRVFIPYVVLGGLFWIIKDILIQQVSIEKFFYDFTLLSFWGNGERVFWYISFISILYIVSPLLYKIGKRGAVVFCILSVVVSIIFYVFCRELFNYTEIAVLRIPIYLFGFYCGRLCKSEKYVGKEVLYMLILSVPLRIIGGLINFPFERLVNVFYAVFLIFLYITVRLRLIKKARLNILINIGQLSLELYIVHVAIRNVMGDLGLKTENLLTYIICMTGSFLIVYIIKLIRVGFEPNAKNKIIKG